MSNLKIISATNVRNNWFEILSWINAEKKEIFVKKNNTIIAKISPGDTPVIDDLEIIIKRTFGLLKNKAIYFPYEDPKIIAKEKTANNPERLWRIK